MMVSHDVLFLTGRQIAMPIKNETQPSVVVRFVATTLLFLVRYIL